MNKIYKLKYSKQLNQMIVVSELANNADKESTVSSSVELSSTLNPDHGQGSTAPSLTSLASLGAALFSVASLGLADTASAEAPRSGLEVVSGSVSVSQVGDTTNLVTSPNAILNWDKFNINANEIVRFIQESSKSSVLNRVLGGEVSKILGQLQSNGRVFIVNPAGIVFGKGSSVNVQSLVASTLDITDANFKAGRYVFNQDKDKAIAGVINAGMIKVADNGSISLVGGQVLNKGVLQARNGSVYLLAGNSIEISDLNNPNISYKVTAKNKAVNLGSIIGKNVSMVANKVSNGLVEESRPSFADLLGEDSSNFEATISASGEVILFGGRESSKVENTAFKDKEFENDKKAARGIAVNDATIKVANKSAKAGNVKVLADYVILDDHSKIDASGRQGGFVQIGGDPRGEGAIKLAEQAFFSQQQSIDVSGFGKILDPEVDRTQLRDFDVERSLGDAGKIAIWGNSTEVKGKLYGTSEYGQGMLFETSGNRISIDPNLVYKTKSYGDKRFNGSWVIDPLGFFITDLNCGSCEDSGRQYSRAKHVLKDDKWGPSQSHFGIGDKYNWGSSEKLGPRNKMLEDSMQASYDYGSVLYTEQLKNMLENVDMDTLYIYAKRGPLKFIQAHLESKLSNTANLKLYGKEANRLIAIENSTIDISSDFSVVSEKGSFKVDDKSFVTAKSFHIETNGSYSINGNLTATGSGGEGKVYIWSSSGSSSVNACITAADTINLVGVQFSGGAPVGSPPITIKGTTVNIASTEAMVLNNINLEATAEPTAEDPYTIKITNDPNKTDNSVTLTNVKFKNSDNPKTRVLIEGDQFIKVNYGPEVGKELTVNKVDYNVAGGTFTLNSGALDSLTFDDTKVTAKNGSFTAGGITFTGSSHVKVTEAGELGFTASKNLEVNDATIEAKGTINAQSEGELKLTSNKAIVKTEGGIVNLKSTGNKVKVEDGAQVQTQEGGTINVEGQTGVTYENAHFIGTGNSGKFNTKVNSGDLEIHNTELLSKGELEFDIANADNVVIDRGSRLSAERESDKTYKFNNNGNVNINDAELTGLNDVSLKIKNKGSATLVKARISLGATGKFDISPESDANSPSLSIKNSNIQVKAPGADSFLSGKDFEIINSTIGAGTLTLTDRGNGFSTIQGSTIKATGTLRAEGNKLKITNDSKNQHSTITSQRFDIGLTGEGSEFYLDNSSLSSSGADSSIDGGKKLTLGLNAVINSNGNDASLQLTAENVQIKDNAIINGQQGSSLTIGGNSTKNIVIGSNTKINNDGGDINLTAKGENGQINIQTLIRGKDLNITAAGNIDLTGVTKDKFLITGGLAVTSGRKITIGEGTALSAKTISLHGGNTSEFGDSVQALSDTELAVEVKKGSLNSLEKPLEVIAHSGSVLIGENAHLQDENTVHENAGTRVYARGTATWTGNAQSNANRNLNISAGKEVLVSTNIENNKKVTLSAVDNETLLPNPSAEQKGKGVVNVKESVRIQAKDFVAEATKDINFKAGSSVSATNSLTAKAVNQTHVATGTTLQTTGKTGSSGDVHLEANRTDTGKVLVEGTVTSTNNLTVKGDDSNFVKGSATTAGNGLFVRGKKITAIGASLTAKNNELSIGGFEAETTTIEGATLRAENYDVNVRGNNSLTVTGGEIYAGRDLNLSAPAGQAEAQGAKVTVIRDINITAGKVILTNQDLDAQNISVVSLKDGTTITDSTLTATVPENGKSSGTLKVTGAGHQNLSNTSLKGKDIEVKSTDEKVTLEKTQVESKKGNVSIEASKNINIGNGSNISAKDAEANAGHICITTTSPQGSIISNGANITAGNNGSKVKLKSGKDISLNNTNISSHQDLDLEADKDIKVIGGTQLNSSNGNINLNSTSGDILSEGGVFGTPKGSPVLTANKGNITLNATDLTVKEDLNLVAGKNVSLGNGTNLSAGKNISIEAKDGNVTSDGVNITAGVGGNVNVTAKRADGNGNTVGGQISLNNTNITSSGAVKLEGQGDVTVKGRTKITTTDKNGDIVLTSTNGSVTSEGGIFDAQGEGSRPRFSAEEGNITLNATNVTVKGDFDLTAGKNVTLGNGTNITAIGGHIHLTANEGNVTTEGSNLTASMKDTENGGQKADVTFTANKGSNPHAGNININNTNIASAGPIKAEADNDITVTGRSRLNTSAAPAAKDGKPGTGDIILTAKNGNLTSEETLIVAPNGSPKLSAANGSITLNATNVTVREGDLDLNSGKDIYLGNGTNLTAQNGGVHLTAKAGNITSEGVNITAGGENSNVTLKAGGAGSSISLNNTNIASHGPIKAEADKDITVTGNSTLNTSAKAGADSTKPQVKGDIELTAKNGNLTSEGTRIIAPNGSPKLSAANGSITLNATNVTVREGDLNLKAGKNIYLGNGTNLTAKDGNVTLTAGAGNITSEGVNITAGGENHGVTLNATKDPKNSHSGSISLNNTNIAANGSIVAEADKDVTITGESILNTSGSAQGKGNITLTAKGGNLTSEATRVIAPKGSPKLSADKGDITLNATNITVREGDLALTAGKNIYLGNGTNLTAETGNVSLIAKAGNITSEGVNITANGTTSSVTLTAGSDGKPGSISLNNTNIAAHGPVNATAQTDVTVKGNSIINTTGAAENQGNITLTATKGNLTSEGTRIIAPAGSPKLSAKEGDITLNATNISVKEGDLDLNAGKNIYLGNGTNLTAQKGGVHLTTKDGNITSEGVNITAGGQNSNVTIKAGGEGSSITLNNTNISSHGPIKAEAGKDVTVKGNSILNTTPAVGEDGLPIPDAEKGDIELTAKKGNLTSEGTRIIAPNGSPKLSAKEGDITLNATNVTVREGNLDLNAGKNIYLGNGTNLTAEQGSVSLIANKGNITSEGVNITANGQNSNVTIKAGSPEKPGSISLNNTNIAAKGPVTAEAEKDVTITGNSIINTTGAEANKGNITLKAKTGNLTSEGTRIIAPDGSPKLSADNGDITLNATNVTVREGDLDLKAGKNIYLGNGTNLTAQKGGVHLTANNGNITSEGVNITAGGDKSNVTLKAGSKDHPGSITLNNTNISSNGPVTAEAQKDVTVTGRSKIDTTGAPEGKGDVTLEAKEGNLTSEGTNIITPNGNPKLSAKQGDITLNATNVTIKEGDLVLDAGKNIHLGNGTNLTANNGNVSLTANKGNITAEGVNITAGGNNHSVTLTANKDDKNPNSGSISLNNTNIAARGPVKAVADKDVTVTGRSKIDTTGAPKGQGDVTLEAKEGNLTSEGTNIITPNGNPKLSAKKGDITLNATNVTIKEGDLVLDAGKNIYLGNGTNLTATKGNVKLTANDGNVTSVGVNISAENGKVDIEAKKGDSGKGGIVTLNNTNISSKGDISATGEKDVNLGNGTQLTTKEGNVTLHAKDGNVTSEGSNITALGEGGKGGHVNITAEAGEDNPKGGVTTLNNTNISAKEDITAKGKNGVNLGNGTQITSQEGNVTLDAGDGSITSQGSNITADKGQPIFKAPKGDITLNNTNVSSKGDIDVEAGKNVNLGNGTQLTTTEGNVTIHAKDGNVTSEGSNITANGENGKGGYVNITATAAPNNKDAGITTLNNTNISAKHDIDTKGDKDVNLGNGTQITTEQGNVTIHAKDGNVTSEGSNITAKGDKDKGGYVSITAEAGPNSPNGGVTTLNNTNISAKEDITAKGDKGVNLGNGTQITSKDGNVTLDAGTGSIKSQGSNITADNGKPIFKAPEGDITLNNTNVSTTGDLDVDAGKNVNLGNGTHLTSKEGNITVTANDGNVTSEGTNITADNGKVDITAKAKEGNKDAGITTLNNTNISSKGDITTTADKDVNLGNGTKLTSKDGNISVTAKDGNVTSEGTNITADKGKVDITATSKRPEAGITTLNNTNISAKDDITTKADKGINLGNGTQLTSKDGNVTLDAGDGSIISQGSNITADKGKPIFIAPKGDISLNNTNVSSKGDIDLDAGKNVNLGNGTRLVSKNGNITLNAQDGNVTSEGSNITADKGKVDITAHSKDNPNAGIITLNNTNISARDDISTVADKDVNLGNGTQITSNKGNVTIAAKGGNVNSEGSNITAKGKDGKGGNVNITAIADPKRPNSGSITLNNTNVSGKNVDASADKDVTLGNGTRIKADQNVTIKAKENVSITGSNVTGDYKVKVDAGNKLKVDNSNISSGFKVELTSENTTEVTDSDFEAPYVGVSGNDEIEFVGNKINKKHPEKGKVIIIGKPTGKTVVTDNEGYAPDIGINGNDITDERNSWNPYPPRYNSDLALPDAPPPEERKEFDPDQPLGFGDQLDGNEDSYRDSGRDTKGSTISSEDPLTSGDDLTLEEGNGIGKGRTVEGKGRYSRASNRRALSGAESSYHYFLGQCYNTAYKIFSAKGFSGGDKDLTLYQLERKYKLSAKEAEALRRSCSDKEMRLVFRDLEEKVLSGQ